MTQLLKKQPIKELSVEKLLKEATSNDDTSPSQDVLEDISGYTFIDSELSKIMKHVWRTLDSQDRKWRKIYKGLQLILYLINNGSPKCVEELKQGKEKIVNLKTFSHFENGQDRNCEIKELSRQVIRLLRDHDCYQKEKDNATKAKMGINPNYSETNKENFLANNNYQHISPTQSTLDSLRNTSHHDLDQHNAQNDRKASIDYFLKLNDSGRKSSSSLSEATKTNKLNFCEEGALFLNQNKYEILNDSIVLPPPPGENSFSFQKSKSQPVSLDTIEDLLNAPAEPIRLENNRFIEPCKVTNTRNALLNPVEFSQRKQISLTNINVCRKQSFSELYKEYKRTKETAGQNIKQHTEDFSQRVNKETPKDGSSQEKFVGQTSKNVSLENYISQEVKLNNKLDNWIDSLMKSPSLVRSKTAISKQEISIEKELSFRKSVSVNLQTDKKYLEPSNQIQDLNKPQDFLRPYIYTDAEELEELYMEFSKKNSSVASENNETQK